MHDIQSLHHLITSSKVAVESYELSQLNRASNLRHEMIELLEKWVVAETEARIARSLLESKKIELDVEIPGGNIEYSDSLCKGDRDGAPVGSAGDRLRPGGSTN